jgi:hypothetical protein
MQSEPPRIPTEKDAHTGRHKIQHTIPTVRIHTCVCVFCLCRLTVRKNPSSGQHARHKCQPFSATQHAEQDPEMVYHVRLACMRMKFYIVPTVPSHHETAVVSWCGVGAGKVGLHFVVYVPAQRCASDRHTALEVATRCCSHPVVLLTGCTHTPVNRTYHSRKRILQRDVHVAADHIVCWSVRRDKACTSFRLDHFWLTNSHAHLRPQPQHNM